MPMQMPRTRQEFFALGGGLDLMTPAIAIKPGFVLDSQNYEPEVSGGYRRIDGNERFDGQPSPSAANYWLLRAAISAPITAGALISGDDSGAAGWVLATTAGAIVLGDTSGTFTAGETLAIGAQAVATAAAPAAINAALDVRDDADWRLLAANRRRALITKVPGSGPIRGVCVFADAVFAVRDTADGTASKIYRASPAGWLDVPLGYEVQFTGATAEIHVGETVSNQGGGPSGVVRAVLLRSGTWTSAGAGTLVFTSLSGAFANTDEIRVGGVQRATAFGPSAPIKRLPGGRCEVVRHNFGGATNTVRLYGADGVNPAFEFDGVNYVPIRTGMIVDTPSHVAGHKNHLFLSFFGSVQFSSVGNPYSWSAVTGAGEIAVGAEITGFMVQAGTQAGAALSVFTREQTHTIYGSSAADFQVVASVHDVGYSPYTIASVSGDAFGMTGRGVQTLQRVQAYGDFEYSALTRLAQPLLNVNRGLECAANVLEEKNQYRVYYSNGYALAIGLAGEKQNGVLPLYYPRPVRCIVTETLSSGREVTYFGSDDGYVYQDHIGTSHDGEPIEAWCRLPFNNLKSPQIRKRIRRATFEVKVASYAQVNISYDLGYGTSDVAASQPQPDHRMLGAGGFWNSFFWNEFVWNARSVSGASISIDGTESNISLLFYSRRAQDGSHTLQGVTLAFTPQRPDRP